VKVKMQKIILIILFSSSLFAQSFKFIAMTDSRGKYLGVNDSVLKPFVNHILKNHDDVKFVLFPGDMVDGNIYYPERTIRELLHWSELMTPFYNNPKMIYPKVFVTVGNHEVRNREDEKNFRILFNQMPQNGPDDEKGITYSFDYNNVHFTIVNTNRFYYGNPDDTSDDRRDWHYIKHLDWIENDIKTARDYGAKHIIVAGHEMPFPTGGHLRDGLPNLQLNLSLPLDSTRQWFLNQRDKFWEILTKYNAAMYICGHEHLYSRLSVGGVYQLLTGSCGAPLYYHNPRFGDTTTIKKPGQEMIYSEAIPYFKILNYDYKEGGNAQVSNDFVGLRAFTYLAITVLDEKIIIETYGAFPKEGTLNEMGSEIMLLDKFEILSAKNKQGH
jgi:hypothetical protein